MTELLNEIVYLFQRLTWTSVLDLFLVTLVVYAVLLLLRDTQVMVLLRGVIIIIVLLAILFTLIDLPAFSWLLKKMR